MIPKRTDTSIEYPREELHESPVIPPTISQWGVLIALMNIPNFVDIFSPTIHSTYGRHLHLYTLMSLASFTLIIGYSLTVNGGQFARDVIERIRIRPGIVGILTALALPIAVVVTTILEHGLSGVVLESSMLIRHVVEAAQGSLFLFEYQNLKPIITHLIMGWMMLMTFGIPRFKHRLAILALILTANLTFSLCGHHIASMLYPIQEGRIDWQSPVQLAYILGYSLLPFALVILLARSFRPSLAPVALSIVTNLLVIQMTFPLQGWFWIGANGAGLAITAYVWACTQKYVASPFQWYFEPDDQTSQNSSSG